MKPSRLEQVAPVVALCLSVAVASHAQTYTTLYGFGASSGWGANSPLVQGLDGNFFGTTSFGGANQNAELCFEEQQSGCGTAFELTRDGRFKVIYNFCAQVNCADGGAPSNGLILGADGNFYGTTDAGGANFNATVCANYVVSCPGTVFKMTPAGELTTLYNFCSQANCADGFDATSLLQARDGNFYGVTGGGGIILTDGYCTNGCGTVFKLTPAGKFTVLYKFCEKPKCVDGSNPIGLMQATDGNFYGMTYYGGTSYESWGTVFEITPAGRYTVLLNFCPVGACENGQYPDAPPIQGGDGNLYGTTRGGGAHGGGTVFELSPGHYTRLYSFCEPIYQYHYCLNGFDPRWALVQGTDGNLYGTTDGGGSPLCDYAGCGVVFEVTPGGQFTNVYTFCPKANCADGSSPGALMQATNGLFYGVTTQGGPPECHFGRGCGTAFSLAIGLGPFVEASPNFGKIGRVVNLLGNNLTGTTSVTFHGTPAKFAVKSGTLIKAMVPVGATTGTIQITGANGTISSNGAFQVLP
jgi:uncharacterized repeat protein (TIGR03803 family)